LFALPSAWVGVLDMIPDTGSEKKFCFYFVWIGRISVIIASYYYYYTTQYIMGWHEVLGFGHGSRRILEDTRISCHGWMDSHNTHFSIKLPLPGII
jgi:hypothetical protein